MGHDADVPPDGEPPEHAPPEQEADGLLSDAEQTISDGEQTLGDLDQTASEEDQGLSNLDQTSSDLDQTASDRDQATADRDALDRPEDERSGWAAARYASSRADRLSTTLARYASTVDRLQVLTRRDEVAALRDQTAEARDEAAAARDRLALRRDERLAVDSADARTASELLVKARMRAGMDRERAARDRRSAAGDRLQAARDRQFAREALRHAHHDELTGTLRRDLGERALSQEIERAADTRLPLTLAVVSVGGVRSLEAAAGAAAADERLAEIVAAMRTHLRSFDTIVRLSDYGFLCGVPGRSRADVAQRFDAITADVEAQPGPTIDVGLAELEDGDTLSELVARAEAAMDAAREQQSG